MRSILRRRRCLWKNSAIAQRAARKREILHYTPADEVFLDDPLERLRPCGVVPGPLGVDQRDGPAIADAQPVGARAVDPVEQSQFAQPPLQIVPRLDARLARAAFRFGLVGA